MTTRTASRLAWSVWGIFFLGGAGTLAFGSQNYAGEPFLLEAALFTLVYGAFATVGALVASRRPANPIGWLLLAIGTGTTIGNATQEYALYTLATRPGSAPGGVWLAWLGSWLWPVSLSLIVMVLLLFPTGRPVSRRWRFVVWLAAIALGGLAASMMFAPGPLDLTGFDVRIENPLGASAAGPIVEAVEGPFIYLLLATVVAAIVSLVVRARRSTGEERQQLKWLGYGAAFMFVMIAGVGNLVARLFPELTRSVGDPLFALSLLAVPISIGVAILRYRLYDIDLIVNRTLVYGALSLILGAVYAGSVFALQGLLAGFASRSNLAIAASTLAVAALFSPLRGRVQRFIDRRFYRSKYDAAKTIEEFSAKLRDEVDLDELSEHLLEVVAETMQPARMSLWLREGMPAPAERAPS